MTLDMLFIILVPTYLVLVAYGQVGARRRRLGGRARLVAGALRVVIVPVALVGALASTGDAWLLARWGGVTLAMVIAGAIVAAVVELIAPKVGA